MSRLNSTFATLTAEGRGGLITYITAGDPDLPHTGAILLALQSGGADVLEVGVPFSDPLADGPVIQRASERALRNGTTLQKVLQLVADVRARVTVPIVLFTYVNPIVRFGARPFAKEAAAAGVDAVLALDLPVEEADGVHAALGGEAVDMIFLVAPTSTTERIRRAAVLGRGFLYAVSRLGVTGARAQVAPPAREVVGRIRSETDLPVAVGFGVSRPEHVKEIGTFADAAVVGSALVSLVEQWEGEDDLPRRIAEHVRWLRGETEVTSA